MRSKRKCIAPLMDSMEGIPEHFGFFKMLGKTFPFAIDYPVEEGQISVCTILDMRRDPSWIRAELETRSEP